MVDPEKGSPQEEEIVRLTLLIRRSAWETTSLMALRHGLTRTEMINQAINDRKWIDDRLDEGSQFQLETVDGRIGEVIFEPGRNPQLTEEDLPPRE